MGKRDSLKDSMRSGLDGLLSPTKSTATAAPQPKQPATAAPEKESAVHCNFIINKSIHTRMRLLGIKKGMTLKDIVNEAMIKYLEENE